MVKPPDILGTKEALVGHDLTLNEIDGPELNIPSSI